MNSKINTKVICGQVWFTEDGCDTAIVVTKEAGPGGILWTARLHDAKDGSAVWCEVKGISVKSAEDAAKSLVFPSK